MDYPNKTVQLEGFAEFEEQLLGATYIKNHFGPTPVEFKKILLLSYPGIKTTSNTLVYEDDIIETAAPL